MECKLTWPEHLAVRERVARALGVLSAQDMITIFHGTEWHVDDELCSDGGTVVTYCEPAFELPPPPIGWEHYLLRQCDEPWRNEHLGDLACAHTVCQQGCYLTNLSMTERIYDLDPGATPLTTQAKLGPDGFLNCNVRWSASRAKLNIAISIVSTEEAIAHIKAGGVAMIRVLPKDPGHFVLCVEVLDDGDYLVLDPYQHGLCKLSEHWDGVYNWRKLEKVGPEPEPSPALWGLNDPQGGTGPDTAAHWLNGHTMSGAVLCVPVFLGETPQALDYSSVQARVIVNLRYSWSTDKGGSGTLPPPEQRAGFIQTCIETIDGSKGVWGWTIGNEYNNPRECPPGFVLTPDYFVALYNEIHAARTTASLAPGAIDPFYGPDSNCLDWFTYIWSHIEWADFVELHGYIRGPDPDLCGSQERFEHEPLTWQYLNYPMCCVSLLMALPDWAKVLDAYVTEFNHLWKTVEPDWGWVNDARAAEVVRAAREATMAVPQIKGVCLYRWKGDDWEVYNNAFVLEELAQ